MVRETSIETYRKIKEDGLLSKMRFEVYDFLYQHGPMTCRELMAKYQKAHRKDFVIAGSSLSTRFSELERAGVVRIVQVRPCKETGRNAIEWICTNRLPVKFEKPHREKCKTCKGKGYVQTQQARLL